VKWFSKSLLVDGRECGSKHGRKQKNAEKNINNQEQFEPATSAFEHGELPGSHQDTNFLLRSYKSVPQISPDEVTFVSPVLYEIIETQTISTFIGMQLLLRY
jgi:hypothetical protein